jgi:hypothetical protein
MPSTHVVGNLLEVRPRDEWAIRNAMAAQVTARVLALLPIGYWQRRVAARAWSLETMPVVPRDSQLVHACRHPGPAAVWTLATDVMTWGLIPWVWQADARTEVSEARHALQQFARSAERPICAALFIAPQGLPGPRTHVPRLRMQGWSGPPSVEGRSCEAGRMPVGVITWPELAEVFAEASAEAGSLRARHAAEYGAAQLDRLAQAWTG